DAADCQPVIATCVTAIAHRRAVRAGYVAEGAHGSGVVTVDLAAVTDGGRLQAIGDRARAARDAKGAHCLSAGTECRGTDLTGGRGLVEQDLAGSRILVVQPAAHRRARVTNGGRAVTGRVGVDAERHRAAAERG